jgi:SAM-dependent methyltransferase
MQKIVYDHFKELFGQMPPPGDRVLEVGAISADQALLPAMELGDYSRAVGIDLDPVPDDTLPFELRTMNANDLQFDDASFDAVICVGVFNNDRYFWRSVGEIHRVLRPGGVFYCHVPAFPEGRRKLTAKRHLYRLAGRLGRNWPIALAENTWLSSVPTYHSSPTPADYWRFSRHAMEEVIMDGLELLHIEEMLYPPRLIAVGRKPA